MVQKPLKPASDFANLGIRLYRIKRVPARRSFGAAACLAETPRARHRNPGGSELAIPPRVLGSKSGVHGCLPSRGFIPAAARNTA